MGFKDVEIKNFRGIKSLEIKDLRQVNLFLGKNNCGKTSVLEALFLLSGMSNPYLLYSINFDRGINIKLKEDFLMMFYEMNSTSPIHIEGKGERGFQRSLDISLYSIESQSISIDELKKVNNSTNKIAGYNWGINFKYNRDSEISESSKMLISTDKNTVRIEDKRYNENISSVFLSTKKSYDVFYTMRLKQLIEEKEDKHIVEILRNIDPKIKSIHLLDNDVVVDIGASRLLPINVLGDGIRKMLSMVVALYQAKDGLLLIDEIDNGLHFSTLDLVWNVIFKTAHKFNVQVMMTTHNEELIQSLDKILSTDDLKEYQKDLACYSLKRFGDDDMRAFRYDYENLSFAMEQNIEIR